MCDLEFIEIFNNNSKNYGVYLMHNESAEEQELFIESFYRSFGFRKQLDLKWFNWYYNQNPFGSCKNYVLIDIEKGTWIGGFGFSKIAYDIKNIHGVGGLAINGFINSGYEGQGLYTQLISKGLHVECVKDRIFFSLPHANNLPSIKGHLKSGWKHFLSLSFIELKVDESRLSVSDAISLEKPGDLEDLNFKLFDETDSLSFTRNFNFLNWRFISRPNKNYTYLKIEIEDDIGYMILGFYESTDGSKRCQIADYRYTSKSCLVHLINRAYHMAFENRCNILDVLISDKSEPFEIFYSVGFKPRQEGYELLTYSINSVLLQNKMLVTYGDFDTV